MSYPIEPTTPHDRPSDWRAINCAEYHIWRAAKLLRHFGTWSPRDKEREEGRSHLRRARHLLEYVRVARIRRERRKGARS